MESNSRVPRSQRLIRKKLLSRCFILVTIRQTKSHLGQNGLTGSQMSRATVLHH
jgi:hypothetical protein